MLPFSSGKHISFWTTLLRNTVSKQRTDKPAGADHGWCEGSPRPRGAPPRVSYESFLSKQLGSTPIILENERNHQLSLSFTSNPQPSTSKSPDHFSGLLREIPYKALDNRHGHVYLETLLIHLRRIAPPVTAIPRHLRRPLLGHRPRSLCGRENTSSEQTDRKKDDHQLKPM